MSRFAKSPALAGLTALIVAGAAGPILAQNYGPPPDPAQTHGAYADAGRDRAQMREGFQAKRAEHARMLHDALALRPDQEGAFRAFVESMTPPPHERMGVRPEARQGGMTTPERLDLMARRMAEHQARFERHAAAVRAFYAVLSPTQQRTFDALAEMHGGMAGRHGHHPGMGHPGMDHPGMDHQGRAPDGREPGQD